MKHAYRDEGDVICPLGGKTLVLRDPTSFDDDMHTSLHIFKMLKREVFIGLYLSHHNSCDIVPDI